MKKPLAYLLGAALLLSVGAVMFAQKTKKHRVVIDVTMAGPDAWTPVLNGIENLQKAFGAANVEIEAVAHEKGLGMVVKASDPGLAERMQRIAGTGVVFAACENSMHYQHVTKGDLFPFDITVDSGAAELVRKQEAGWAYIKAGP
jgi:uncharacterized protein